MKFISATLVYLVIALILGAGILLATHGHVWLLAIGGLVYVLLFAAIGCKS